MGNRPSRGLRDPGRAVGAPEADDPQGMGGSPATTEDRLSEQVRQLRSNLRESSRMLEETVTKASEDMQASELYWTKKSIFCSILFYLLGILSCYIYFKSKNTPRAVLEGECPELSRHEVVRANPNDHYLFSEILREETDPFSVLSGKLFSFSVVMYSFGGIIIFGSYLFQMFKFGQGIDRPDASRPIQVGLSIIYAVLFGVLAESLYFSSGSVLLGGWFYCSAVLLVGAASCCFDNFAFRRFSNLSKLFMIYANGVDEQTPGDFRAALPKEDISMFTAAAVRFLSAIFISALLLYRRTHFPALLFFLYCGAFGLTHLLAFLMMLFVPFRSLLWAFQFVSVVFFFGGACGLLNLMCLYMAPSDPVVAASLTIAGLNCCVPTLPILISKQLFFPQDRNLIENFRAMPKNVTEPLHFYRIVILLLYTYANLCLMLMSSWFNTLLHVPYILAVLLLLTLTFHQDWFMSLFALLPAAVGLLAMPSILVNVNDAAVLSLLAWIGDQAAFHSLLLNSVRLSCGVLGGVIFFSFFRLQIALTYAIPCMSWCLFIALGRGEHYLVAGIYNLLAGLSFSVFFILCLSGINSSSEAKSIMHGVSSINMGSVSILHNLFLSFISYRLMVNAQSSAFLSALGSLLISACLFHLYFMSPDAQTAHSPNNDNKKTLKAALRRASVRNIVTGLVISLFLSLIAISQRSFALSWIGLSGVYAFFAAVTLRLTTDWSIIALVVTAIGCLTIVSGTQLEHMSYKLNSTLSPRMVDSLGLLVDQIEADTMNKALSAIVSVLYAPFGGLS